MAGENVTHAAAENVTLDPRGLATLTRLTFTYSSGWTLADSAPYAYDRAGNRTDRSARVGNGNRLLPLGG